MNKQELSYGIHWFRRDLRIAGNRALRQQLKKHQGRVLGLFCFDRKFLSREDFSANRFQFFLKTLLSLREELRALGSDLLVLDEGPFTAFPELLSRLQAAGVAKPAVVSWHRDYEPFARDRDRRLEEMMNREGIDFFVERDHLLIEPEELERAPGKGYQVYSPFARQWLKIFQSAQVKKRIQEQKTGFDYIQRLQSQELDEIFSLRWSDFFAEGDRYPDHLLEYLEKNEESVDVPIPEGGTLAAYQVLCRFQQKIDRYGDDRDIPSLEGTSGLSLFFKNGSLTISQVIFFLALKAYDKKTTGRDKFFSELIWREFYYHILYRHPEVESLEFVEKYRGMKWENDRDLFDAWKAGKTGFPIVDAGMRQLRETGWMHNRVRMIVASFLTKDLLIDWRWGEKYFMEKLLDGDIAPNNGGWQWAASTGCDPQPYFRIFNPWLQGKKFDPEGVYIKKYVPELRNLPVKELHAPIEGSVDYPAPVVDHRRQRDKALALYKAISPSGGSE